MGKWLSRSQCELSVLQSYCRFGVGSLELPGPGSASSSLCISQSLQHLPEGGGHLKPRDEETWFAQGD